MAVASMKGVMRMSDMTSAAAIDLLDNLIGMVDDNQGSDYDSALHMAIDALKTQAERTEERTETHACDLISRQAAIDAFKPYADYESNRTNADWVRRIELVLHDLPSAQPDLIAKIQNGINATNANDSYSCGMRNGMRWCMSLVDDKEPLFENCPSAQPTGTPLHDNGSDYSHGFADGYKQGLKDAESERVRCKDCKQFRRWIDTDISFCDITEAEMSDNDFCSKAERITDEM